MEKEPNMDAMRTLLGHGTLAYDETFYKNIKRLPSGHFMRVDSEYNVEIERYWKPEEIKINETISEEEAKEKFLEIFSQAIEDRIDDPSTTSFELSGGLDSSSVVSIANHLYPQQQFNPVSMNCRSMPKCNEEEYLDSMQELDNIETIKVHIDTLDYQKKYSLENNYKLNPYWPILITYTMGFPLADKFQDMGIKRVLTGKGGDQVMAGNFYGLSDYFRDYKWIQLYRELRATENRMSKLKKYILIPLLGEDQKNFLKSLLQRLGLRKNNILNINSQKNFQEFQELYLGDSKSFKNELGGILTSTLSLYLDFSYYPVVKKHHGITYCHPFYDRRLIEFMLSLPIKFKYKEGVDKVLLRRAMKNILPEKIRQRQDKAEFTSVLKQQIDAIDLDELLGDTYLVKFDLIEQSEIDKLKEDYQSGRMKTVLYFWRIINLEYWYRYNFVNNKEKV